MIMFSYHHLLDGRRRRAPRTVAVALAVLAAGCGGQTAQEAALTSAFYPVRGQLVLPDGKAPPPIKVVFSGPVTSSATTEGDGSFVFKGTKDGLPAGEYNVRLEVVEPGGTTKRPALPFPAKYLDRHASGLSATVKPEASNDFEFKLNTDAPAGADRAVMATRRGR
ncbi:MAG: carboxypeptidase-like regulatory domain-containing protein [Isosphaeraceae bacterium]